MTLAADEIISRCLIFNRFFPGNIHTDSALWAFGGSGSDGRAHESGVARSLAPSHEDVHRIGCKIAAKQNAERGEPASGPNRKYYVGFRTAKFADITLKEQDYELEFVIIEELGEPAHVDVSLLIHATGKNARGQARTNAGLALAEVFDEEPELHVCQADLEDREHPLAKFGRDKLFPEIRDRWPQPIIDDDPLVKASSNA